MSVNPAQWDVLDHLTDGPKYTSNVTAGGFVSGVAANALERQGLVTIRTTKKGRRVTLTRAGRSAQRRSVLARVRP